MNDLKVLVYLDLLKIKNFFFQIFHNPILFLKKLFSIIIFFGLCFSSFIVAIFKNEAKASVSPEMQQATLGIIAIISLVFILFVLANYLNDYAPSNFSISDISYLFPSPINNRLILFYSMVRSAIKGVASFFLTFIFIILMILASTDISLIGLFPIALGFFFIFLFFISLSYLFFAIKIKTGIVKILKLISYLLQGIACLIFLFYLYKFWSLNFNFTELSLSIFNSFIVKLPIISSIVRFISLLLTETITPPIFDILYLLSLVIINCFLFITLNIEYYEEIAEKVSTQNEKLKQLKNNKRDVHSQMEKEMKKVNLNSSAKERWGVLSLYWKASVIRKRKQTPIKKYLLFLVNIIIGLIGGYVTLKGHQLISLLVISIGTVYIVLILSNFSELSRELKNVYIYLIPGKPINKILSTVLDELLILLIRISIMLIPSIILDYKFLILGIGCYLMTLALSLVVKLLNLIIILLMPKDNESGPGMLATFVLMIIIMIPFVATVVTYAITKNSYISFAVLTVIVGIYISLLMLLCNKIFDFIEY
ncbi:putative ABC exporter domain-containing protein [Clostridium sp. DSM 100503]|uniref:putative ABC exporter domain-containing protein n=1 Tax=Clostridium sp. DSM 100503 TaxID=2963282 RepID=UPI002149D606|nr:putative ABC exporter domain-containing protein [Clostridium sp. DSM 100503]MCR1949546.1 putative ABC exporter domain-containing protein [Clostridium sp. DSM 100503]